ncbi:carboxymuconolactone decarboxylase family protein [Mycolicibacterium cosmeticum]|uniref:carboxymuconolactone decarboxylase family protein n=1 Tax=Mycolicibacterium cosmeticum TaxID=258533 RepID=UPI003204640E
MALVPLLAGSEFSEVDRDVLAAGEKAYGKVLNTWAAIGHSPGLFAAYLPFLRQVNGPGQLETRIKELTALRIAVLNHCSYTTSHRSTAALANGATEQELAAIARGEFSDFTERERLALLLADEMTRDLPRLSREQSATGTSDFVRDAAKEVFDPRELVELTMSIGLWNALSRFHRVMDFDLDMPEAPPAIQAAL